jgi:glycine betaine catabolism B
MLKPIDDLLNRITMYRLVLYYLIFLLGVALFLSFTGGLAYDPYALLFSTAFLLAACAATNWAFARAFAVPSNVESTYISALILALIITPIQSYNDLWFLGWAAVLAMACKYILALGGKHPFNPVAFGVAVTYFAINQSASWWVGDAALLPFVLLGGLLLVRKLRRFDLVLSFGLAGLATVLGGALVSGQDALTALVRLFQLSPFAFFAFVLLTEPLTTPPTRRLRILCGALVGFLFPPVLHIGGFYTTPELALLIGNLFAYFVSPRRRLVLTLKDRVRLSPDTYEFVFAPSRKLAFAAGQYMEWTLAHPDPDSRGNRRYFTLASSPTERDLRLGVKFYRNSSSFKRALGNLSTDVELVAAQLGGDFTLPADPYEKCVFIAGGIGITPFRSMLKYLLDTHQRRHIILFYANRSVEDILYKDVFDRAEKELGIRTIYTVTEPGGLPPNWQGLTGRIAPQWITRYVPDYYHHTYYLSGPPGMVDSFKEALSRLGISASHIKTDYFSGL